MVELDRQCRVMYENMTFGAFIQAEDGSLIDVNPAALAMFGLTRDQFKGLTAEDPSWHIINEDGSLLSPTQYPPTIALRTGLPVRDHVAGIFNRTSNRFVWMTIDAIPLSKDEGSHPDRVFVTLHDISELKRMNDIHSCRLHLIQFADSHTLEELLVATLDELEKLTGSVIGFYHIYDEGRQDIRLKAWSTRTSQQFCHVEVEEGHYSLDKAGVWGDCIQSGMPIVHNDYASLTHRRGLPEGHAPIIRELVVPVKRQDRIVAILGVGNKPCDYNETDVETVLLFADMAWDIVEQKRFELQQQQAIQQYEALANTSMDGFWVVDSSARIIIANETLCRLYGYSREELLTKSMRDFEVLETDEQMLAHHDKIKADGYDRFETRHFAKDGRKIHVEVSTAYITKDRTYVAFIRDISARKQAEEELRKSEKRFRSLFESSPDAIFLTLADGKIEACNSATCDMFGWTEEEICKLGRSGILDVGDPRLSAGLQERQRTGKVHGLELTAIRKNGESFAVEVDSVTMDEESQQSFVIMRDTTERKRAEAERLMLEKLESVGMLAGGIAHDFNNILTGLYGNITLARMKLAVDHPGLRYLEAAEQSMQRATFLTSQLLTFAKGGAPVKKTLSLGGLVKDVINFNLAGSNVRPMIKLADKLWSARADHGQIQQVFASLTTNARQAMPDGGHLHVSLENAVLADNAVHGLDAGNYLRITMADEGAGIAPEHLDRIFEPYFTTKQSGSGLGLATTYSIIDKHNGHISVISRPGKGTTFTLYLPACTFAETPAEQPETAAAPTAQLSRVLVMDDEEMIRNLLRDMLGESGFAIETAAEGRQAIDLYRQAMDAGTPFAVVILDLTVPGGMGGQDAAEGILLMDPGARIIVSSGYADDPVMANFADYGFRGVAPKPYRLDKLSGVLAEALSNR